MTSSPATTIAYDGGLAPVSPTPPQWGTSMQNVAARGNPVYITSPSGVTVMNYDVTGTPTSVTANGVTSQVITSTATNWATPSELTVGSLSQTMSYNSFLGLTNTSNYITTYTYDILGHVAGVPCRVRTARKHAPSPIRGITCSTNPENGTVAYTYNQYAKVAIRTAAKNQQVQYTYDSYARLTEVQRRRSSISHAEACATTESNWPLLKWRNSMSIALARFWRCRNTGC